jgi:hypothetical protein
MRSTFVDYIKLWKGFYSGTTSQFFVIEASVDEKNWMILLKTEPGAQVLENTLYLSKKGHFRHYRLRFAKDIAIRGCKFYGYYIDDELFELRKIMPLMTSNPQSGFSITSSGNGDGALFNLTSNGISSYVNFSTRLDGEFWIKYELPKPEVVNLLDIASHKDEANRFPLWFKIEASNDDESWTLLLERAALTYWNGGTTKQYYIDNHTAYKFYKFTPLELVSTEFRLARFRLYRKIAAQESFQKFIPVLSGESQGGYEVSCSSQLKDYYAYYAFDGNASSLWGTIAGSAQNSWIQIKFPTETLCNAVSLKVRGDEYYPQGANFFEIQGSNDGLIFSTLDSITTVWTQGEEKIFEFFNDVAFLYYRIFINTVQDNGDYASFAEINFGTVRREYKRELNVKEFLLPIMGANSQDGYEVFCNSEYDSGWRIWRAFDRNTANSWSTAYNSPVTTILITMPTAKVCNSISVYPRSGQLHQAFGTFSLYGSSDGDNWTELLSVENISTWSTNVEKSWEVENDLAFLRYKIIATPINGENCVSVNNINLLYKYTVREY